MSSAYRRTGQKLRKRPTGKQLLTALEQQLYFSLRLLHAAMTVGTHGSQSLSCPRHRHGEHAGEICFWSLSQKRLALYHVVNSFGDIGRVIAHALKILCTEHQVSAEYLCTAGRLGPASKPRPP